MWLSNCEFGGVGWEIATGIRGTQALVDGWGEGKEPVLRSSAEVAGVKSALHHL